MVVAELSILISFLVFLILFAKKVYPLIINGLDQYIESVKKLIAIAENKKAVASEALQAAKNEREGTKKEIEGYKKASREKFRKIEEQNRLYLEVMQRKAEVRLNTQLQAELTHQKEVLVNKLSDLIISKLSKAPTKQNPVNVSKEDLQKLI